METDPLLTYSSHNHIKNIEHTICLSRIKKGFEKEVIEAFNRKIAIQSQDKHSATRKKNYSKERPSMQELNEKMKKLVNTMELDVSCELLSIIIRLQMFIFDINSKRRKYRFLLTYE